MVVNVIFECGLSFCASIYSCDKCKQKSISNPLVAY